MALSTALCVPLACCEFMLGWKPVHADCWRATLSSHAFLYMILCCMLALVSGLLSFPAANLISFCTAPHCWRRQACLAQLVPVPQGSAGSQAVRAAGSGVLRGVRAIPLLRGTLFWFVVDSAAPGGAPARSAPAQLPSPDAGSPNPGSAGPAPPAREPGRAQERLDGRLPQPGRSGRGSGVGDGQCDATDGAAQQRSKAWHAARHRAVAACECEDVERVAQAKRPRWE